MSIDDIIYSVVDSYIVGIDYYYSNAPKLFWRFFRDELEELGNYLDSAAELRKSPITSVDDLVAYAELFGQVLDTSQSLIDEIYPYIDYFTTRKFVGRLAQFALKKYVANHYGIERIPQREQISAFLESARETTFGLLHLVATMRFSQGEYFLARTQSLS